MYAVIAFDSDSYDRAGIRMFHKYEDADWYATALNDEFDGAVTVLVEPVGRNAMQDFREEMRRRVGKDWLHNLRSEIEGKHEA